MYTLLVTGSSGLIGSEVVSHFAGSARFIEVFWENPRCGEVYNLGGGRANSVSILEAFERATASTGNAMPYEYGAKHREGDHICYISDIKKTRTHCPTWDITRTLDATIEEIVQAWRQRLSL